MKKLLITILFCAIPGMAGCGSGVHDVVYSVTGETSTVEIFAKVENGKIFSESGIELPWTKEFTNNIKWPLHLQVTNEGTGPFEARITVDGALVASGTGEGAGDVVNIIYDAAD